MFNDLVNNYTPSKASVLAAFIYLSKIDIALTFCKQLRNFNHSLILRSADYLEVNKKTGYSTPKYSAITDKYIAAG